MLRMGHWVLNDLGALQVAELIEQAGCNQLFSGGSFVIADDVPFTAARTYKILIEFWRDNHDVVDLGRIEPEHGLVAEVVKMLVDIIEHITVDSYDRLVIAVA